MWLKHPVMTEGKFLSKSYYVSFVIWHRILGNKEISCSEDEFSIYAHDSLDAITWEVIKWEMRIFLLR